jgi:hypothetical protein
LNIIIREQPPNSPDLNVLDLGIFRALQSLQYQLTPKNETELIAHVKQVYNNFDRTKLNNVWLTLQCCMNSIIECDGSNNYQITHMNKMRLERLGLLPRSIAPVQPANLNPLFAADAGDEFDQEIDALVEEMEQHNEI